MPSLRLILISSLLVSGCTDRGDEFALDDEAAGDEGKADGLGTITRLERATPAEVTATFTQQNGGELVACFDAYRARFDASATKLTKAVADQFITLAIDDENGPCADWDTLAQTVEGVLDHLQVASATPAKVVATMPAWIAPQLVDATTGGFVMSDVPLLFYNALNQVRDANARERERNPTGVDLAAIRAAWDEVRDETTLDRAYLNPVTFPAGAVDGTQLFRYLRAAFPLRGLTLQASGYTAINEFAAASEGPDGDPEFAPIATALRKSSIKKRFYFARTGEWSSNVLVVIDQHGQAWGMQMGYSE